MTLILQNKKTKKFLHIKTNDKEATLSDIFWSERTGAYEWESAQTQKIFLEKWMNLNISRVFNKNFPIVEKAKALLENIFENDKDFSLHASKKGFETFNDFIKTARTARLLKENMEWIRLLLTLEEKTGMLKQVGERTELAEYIVKNAVLKQKIDSSYNLSLLWLGDKKENLIKIRGACELKFKKESVTNKDQEWLSNCAKLEQQAVSRVFNLIEKGEIQKKEMCNVEYLNKIENGLQKFIDIQWYSINNFTADFKPINFIDESEQVQSHNVYFGVYKDGRFAKKQGEEYIIKTYSMEDATFWKTLEGAKAAISTTSSGLNQKDWCIIECQMQVKSVLPLNGSNMVDASHVYGKKYESLIEKNKLTDALAGEVASDEKDNKERVVKNRTRRI